MEKEKSALRARENIYLDNLNLALRTSNCLRRSNLKTLEDLNKHSVEWVQRIRNMGDSCFFDLTDTLHDYYDLLSDEWKEACNTYSVLKNTENEFYMLPFSTAIIVIKHYSSLSDIAQKGEENLFNIRELRASQYNTIGRTLVKKGYIKEAWIYKDYLSKRLREEKAKKYIDKRAILRAKARKEKKVYLSERERDIAYKRIIENRTLQEIGNEYNITRERVRQMFDKSASKLATLYLRAERDRRKADEHE